MSKYTTQVRFICENSAGLLDSAGYGDVNSIIQRAIPKVFNFDFPIYDESYRNVLCTKILKHYYTREIGMETVGLWKLRLDTKLNEIMPYYNQLYKSAIIEFNPMHDIDMTTEYTRDNDGTTDVTESSTSNENKNITREKTDTNKTTAKSTTTSSEDGTSRDLFSDTPQGGLTGLENNNYLTNARKITTDNSADSSSNGEYNENKSGSESVDDVTAKTGNNTGKTTVTTTEEYIQTIRGKSAGASYSKRLMEFRETFLNIDMQVIHELSDLFMGLW